MEKGCTAVVVAAGSARRMQGIDKIMTPVGGVPLLLRTVRALAVSRYIDSIVIVTRRDLLDEARALCAEEEKLACVAAGGESRAESVRHGLDHVTTELVAVHDGARPLVSGPVIAAAVEAALRWGAAAPALPVHDTIKIARDGVVARTPKRDGLFAVQTPQVFLTERLRAAIAAALAQGLTPTDDCSAVEAAGWPVHLTPGSEENLKITVPLDLTVAEAILKRREDT